MSIISSIVIIILLLFLVINASLKARQILLFLVLSFSFRILLAYMDYVGFISLPYGRSDALNFSERALQWCALPMNQFLLEFNPRGSYVYSWIGAGIYKIFGPEEMLLRAINAFLGTYAMFITWLTVKKITGYKPESNKILYLASLFPPFLFMSCVTMREMFIIFPFCVGLYYCSCWARTNKSLHALLAILSFVVAGLFHGAMVLAIVAFMLFALYSMNKSSSEGYVKSSIKSKSASILVVLTIIIFSFLAVRSGVVLSSGIDLDRQSDMAGLTESIEERFGRLERGDSAYPAFVRGDPFSKPYLFPMRYAYFLLSPFPWDIRSAYQALGLVSSVFFALSILFIFKRRSFVGNGPLLALLFIFIMMTFVFSVGTHNIGTAVRHRTKFFLLLLMMVWVIMEKARLVRGSRNEG